MSGGDTLFNFFADEFVLTISTVTTQLIHTHTHTCNYFVIITGCAHTPETVFTICLRLFACGRPICRRGDLSTDCGLVLILYYFVDFIST
jgi:hypothetical protein